MNSFYKKKILVIYNGEHWFENLKECLSNYPFEIIAAYDAKSGFELLKQNKPDIILASAQLNDIDGIELCWMIRQSPELAKIPYLLITENTNIEEQINAYRSGVDAILKSTISVREIYTRIEAIFKRTQQLNHYNSLQGKIHHFAVVEILQMLHIAKKSGTLTLVNQDKKGQIGFWEGKLIWAELEELIGEDAVKEITCWKHGHFTFQRDLIHPIININTPSMKLILDCCKILDEKNDQP